ncbi:MAG TPA: hypothetical protein GX505_13480 [Clostridiales bacterium]|nr:hypothetical protein [Clostridiales bacterium]
MKKIIPICRFAREECIIVGSTADGTIVEFNGANDCLKLEGENGILNGVDFAKVDFISTYMTNLSDADMNIRYNFWSDDNLSDEPDIYVIFALLPGVRTKTIFPLKHLDAQTVFPVRNPGTLTELVWGTSMDKAKLRKFTITTVINQDWYPKRQLVIDDIVFTDEEDNEFPLPYARLTDELGQQAGKDWPGKTHGERELIEYLRKEAQKEAKEISFKGWNKYGGWLHKRFEPTGYFRAEKAEGRWWMIDPEGYIFFSLGVNHVMPGVGSKVNRMESLYGWLPDRNDPIYKDCWHAGMQKGRGGPDPDCVTYNFHISNLIRAFGEQWWDNWARIIKRRLKEWGFNTIANWSDPRFIKMADMPYVLPLRGFPDTDKHIFRDFPDVFDPQYKRESLEFAKQLEPYKEDRNLIGYFLTNEPLWALLDCKYVVIEMLNSNEQYYSKDEFIKYIAEKYGYDIQRFNNAWGIEINSFDDLKHSIPNVRDLSGAAGDIDDFAQILVRRYVTLPSQALKAVDPNHMNLGMRYSFVSEASLKNASIGYENFDVFSINSYTYSPEDAFEKLKSFADLPAIIGEFHFGALDRGMWHVGLKGVPTQEERGWAYKYYVENGAVHPNCVGLHYFPLDDEPLLGRSDGENFQMGFHDVCFKPYREFVRVVRETNKTLYQVITGFVEKYDEMPDTRQKLV